MAPDRGATAAELSFVHLENCLVNLPSSLFSLLVNTNTLAQNVIVEISYQPDPSKAAGSTPPSSVFVGWTGMQSKHRGPPLITREGVAGTRGSSIRDRELSLVEIGQVFAQSLGLSNGQKVAVSIHVDPPVAHTVHIEPVTPEDWEIIELHATFLETNLVTQIRALPNPQYTARTGGTPLPHPLIVHLSHTSAAKIAITALQPQLPTSALFAKLSPDAEVIVAPKSRSKPARSSGDSITFKRSTGRSRASAAQRKSAEDEGARSVLFFRALDRNICNDYFDDTEDVENQALKVWIAADIMRSRSIMGTTWATIMLIKPPSLQPPLDPQKLRQDIEGSRDAGLPAHKIVARLLPWEDALDNQHAALSSTLCASLGCEGIVGGLLQIEIAPQQIPKDARTGLKDHARGSSSSEPQKLKIYPYASGENYNQGLRFGGETKTDREEIKSIIASMYGSKGSMEGLLDGPITDGLYLPMITVNKPLMGWEGGLLRFDNTVASTGKPVSHWFLGSERKYSIELQAPIPRPCALGKVDAPEEYLPEAVPNLAGIDPLIEELRSHLSRMSSVLLTGSLGSGKTSVTYLLGHRLRKEELFHTTYLSCRKLVTADTRISSIKESLNRVFMAANWGARLGGRSLVILDDVDKLCPVENELEIGIENSRSRQISENVRAIVRQHCQRNSSIVLLATAQGKESVHNVIMGGHIVREIVSIRAPDKECRRRIVEMVTRQSVEDSGARESRFRNGSLPITTKVSANYESWMLGASEGERSTADDEEDSFVLDEDLDFVDLVGQTDGFMPGDLVQVVSRARSEALIRAVSSNRLTTAVNISRLDFGAALKGFTPASLRNVTLQTSTTTFDSVGGLRKTRKILVETLQYPTIYAPIFAQCPLRLRSGLLLYGYPGCGKTLLASAVAGECGLNFISVKGPEILNKYIGASEKSVRDLFERAEAARPCVLFFDEFDSIAPKRGHDSTGVTDRVVNQLLTQMDGAEGLSGVYVLAATSRPDLIDPALLRPGRLDMSLLCNLPDLEDRVDILRALGKKLKLSSEVQNRYSELAERTPAYSGADLQALVYNAHLEAIHDVLGENVVTTSGVFGKSSKLATQHSAPQEFVQFLYGEEENRRLNSARSKFGNNLAAQTAERAAISAKLAEINKMHDLASRFAKGDSGALEVGNKATGSKRLEKGEQEVTIQWRHMEKSLLSMRASISVEERRRLGAIYREFVVDRSGEMFDGDGGREVGGRVSLM